MQVTDAMVAKAVEAAKDSMHDLPGDVTEANYDEKLGAVMRAALTAALAEMWRPIEEAPKDGTNILIAGGTYYNSMSLFNEDYPFEGRTIAKWDDYHRQWRGENSGGHDEYFWHKPTAWQPLPPPPMGRG